VNILLISRGISLPLRRILSQDDQLWIPVCVNHPVEAMFYLENYPEQFDSVLIVEQDQMEEEVEGFLRAIEKISERYQVKNILTITRNKKLYEAFRHKEIKNHTCEFIHDIKIAPLEILDLLKKHKKETTVTPKRFGASLKKGLLKGEKNSLDASMKANLVRTSLFNHPKVLAFTGHKGAGATSTASDVAYMASHMGIKTFLLDLDFAGRGMNLYFTKYGEEVDAKRQIEDGILRCMKSPDNFEKLSCRINENLFISGLAYSYEIPNKELERIYEGKSVSLIFHILKEHANLVILDAPKLSIKNLEGLSKDVDSFGVCLNNSTYSLINTSKMLLDCGKEDPLFLRKLKIIGTKFNHRNTYNGKPFTLNTCMDLLSQMLESEEILMKPTSTIPYLQEFELSLDSRKKLVSSNEAYKKNILEVLENLI
jgi:hypothetical protein